MNDQPFKNVKSDPAYALSESEKRDMRAKLVHAMHTQPLRKPTLSVWFVYLGRSMPVALALILVISTTSVSFAASGALPGEILYSVKTKVNEKVELALASSHEAKATVQVRQAEERLKEVEVLAVRGEVGAELIEETAQSVARHVEAAKEASDLLEEEGDMVASESIDTRVSVALEAHAELLDAHADNFESSSGEALRSLSRSLQVTADSAGNKEEVLDGEYARMRAEAAQARAEERIAKLKAFLKKNGIPEETELEVEGEYFALTEDLMEGEVLATSEDYRSATDAYERIERRAHRALTWLTSAQEISEETDQEVVIVFEDEEEPVALAARAKTTEPEVATMMVTLEAASVEEVELRTEGLFLLRKED